MKVDIPFDDRFCQDLVSGAKLATIRRSRKGRPGDRFDAFGVTFQIDAVLQMPLGHAIASYYPLEGAKASEDVVRVLQALYGDKMPGTNDQVIVHTFHRVPQ